MKIYISGPMSGHVDMNRSAFNAAESLLRRGGYRPLNPVRNGVDEAAPYLEHMRADLRMLLEADAVAVLPDWERSNGARIEVGLAQSLNMNVRPLPDFVFDEPEESDVFSGVCDRFSVPRSKVKTVCAVSQAVGALVAMFGALAMKAPDNPVGWAWNICLPLIFGGLALTFAGHAFGRRLEEAR